MRMWMVDPRILCRKHLLGEHVELSMFIGTFKRKLQINGYIKKNLIEPLSLLNRHDELEQEIIRRDMNHNSPFDFELCLLDYLKDKKWITVNPMLALDDLIRRCPVCAARYQVLIDVDWIPKTDYDVKELTNGIEYNRELHLGR